MKKLWNFFSLYEKIWFFSVLVLSVLFCFLFPETDDPTYTLTLSGGKGAGKYTVLDFRGTEDDFVLQSVSVNGIEYGVGEFTSAKEEYTVTPDMPETLRLPLPVPVTASDTLEILCYPDGDSEILTLNVADEEGNFLYSGGYPLTKDASGDTFSVKENPQFFVSVGVIMALYLLDTLANVLCELLISKQSRYNFLVSLLVEAVEIALCVVCMYRFATLAVTLFFWIPIDIISFINWNRHPDQKEEELTEVRKLSGLAEFLIITG
ncbi:MAG: nicotinamide mononucleotide transporter, partial [Clostridia bacterium]|nr:nicotinamide mononucleotide transporter [Clostridia bacterium]